MIFVSKKAEVCPQLFFYLVVEKNMNLKPYIQIARPDHWFKNIFILPGICLALFFSSIQFEYIFFLNLFIAVVSVCLVASSNYVLNEILDAPMDILHPEKKERPLAKGDAKKSIAYIEWIILGFIGLSLAFMINKNLGFATLALWIMGTFYNVPPIRLKELPYFDVLSEAINNPLRLLIGWYASGAESMPPLSIIIAYWMFGSFLMAVKRLAEYRMINDEKIAGDYRKSFKFYNDERLIVSIIFYASLFALMSGVFIARYRIDLVVATPLVAYCMAYYLHIGFKPNSSVQHPEKLINEPKLMIIVTITFIIFAVFLFYKIPHFKEMFDPWILPK